MYGVITETEVALPPPPPGPRRHIAALIDRHRWVVPATPSEARVVWNGLERLERRAQERHGRDTVARLFALRLATFRCHWPTPPGETRLEPYRADLQMMIDHDLPRLRRLLSGMDERKASARWLETASAAACSPRPRRRRSETAVRKP